MTSIVSVTSSPRETISSSRITTHTSFLPRMTNLLLHLLTQRMSTVPLLNPCKGYRTDSIEIWWLTSGHAPLQHKVCRVRRTLIKPNGLFALRRWMYMPTQVRVGVSGVCTSWNLTPLISHWHHTAYRKEDCNSDPGWCFLAAVGKALPSTFFSYGAGASKAVLANNYDNPSTSNPSPSPTNYNAYYQHPDAPLIRGQNIRRPVSFAKRQQAKCSLRKRDSSDNNPSSTPSGTSPAPEPFITDPAQKGYSDGYMTAQIFSQHGSSKLGFTGQYIRDSIDALRSRGINNQNQGAYTDSFVKGLSEGEAAVVAGHA